MKKFWIVMNAVERPARYGHVYYRHDTAESATKEAKRLSAKYRATFVVLESVSAWEQPTPAATEVSMV